MRNRLVWILSEMHPCLACPDSTYSVGCVAGLVSWSCGTHLSPGDPSRLNLGNRIHEFDTNPRMDWTILCSDLPLSWIVRGLTFRITWMHVNYGYERIVIWMYLTVDLILDETHLKYIITTTVDVRPLNL